MLTYLVKLLKVLGSETQPHQIAAAVSLGTIMGLTPLLSLHNLLILFLVCLLRINLSIFFFAFVVMSALAFLLDPWFHQFGFWLLTLPALESFWTALYNTDLGRLSAFNNTVTLGSLVVALLALAPLHLASVWLVVRYRAHILERINRWRVMTYLKSSRIYQVYQELNA